MQVMAGEERVAVGRFPLEHTVTHVENGDVERTTTQVIDGNRFVGFLVQTIGQRRSGWFVDDAHHFQTSDLSRVFGRVTLAVVEVRRYGDNRLLYRIAQICFSVALHLAQ